MGNLPEFRAGRPAPQSSAELFEKLTPRQLDVLAMLCEGLPNKLIARRLNISAGTVKVHVVHIHRALGVSSRLQAVVAARALGFDANRPVPAGMEAAVVAPASRITPIPVPPAHSAPMQPEGPLSLLTALMARRLDTVTA